MRVIDALSLYDMIPAIAVTGITLAGNPDIYTENDSFNLSVNVDPFDCIELETKYKET